MSKSLKEFIRNCGHKCDYEKKEIINTRRNNQPATSCY